MNDKGNIKEFETAAQAKKESYRHQLSPQEARELAEMEKEKRLSHFLTERYCLDNKKKFSPIEKARLQHFAEFVIETINGVE